MTNQEILEALADVCDEISRLNRAAGHTVFNPAATAALDAVIDEIAPEPEYYKAGDWGAALWAS